MSQAILIIALLSGLFDGSPAQDSPSVKATQLSNAIEYCEKKPGDGCVGDLVPWVVTKDAKPWAIGCNIGGGRFCAWCTNTGKTILYHSGAVPKATDCGQQQ